MWTDFVLGALRMALATRSPGADFTLVAHTGQDSQYVSAGYTQQLDGARVLASVGSVGDAYENALAKSLVTRLDGADPVSRVALGHAAGARDRRVGGVV